MAPIWDELAETVATEEAGLQDFVIGKVDCTTDASVCSRFGVNSYPTLKLIANHKVYSYQGGRTLDEFTSFLGQGGDFNGDGQPVPSPPSILEDFISQNKEVKELVEDFNHIIALRKNAAAVLLVIGFASGIMFSLILSMIFKSKSATTKAKTD